MKYVRILLLCSLAVPAFGAFNAGMQWDVQTTGSDSNGGGFDPTVASPGTDQSQSGGQAYTDIVIGGTTTTGTSAAHPFSATTNGPGNVINIVSGGGCTVQRVEILSVSGSTATFDKSLGTAASTCTGHLGDPLLSVDLVTKNTCIYTAGNTEHIKAGTYTRTTTWVIDNIGNCNAITIVGYQTTHWDNGTKPLVTTATNSVKLMQGGNPITFYNMSFSNTATVRADGLWFNGTASTGAAVVNCIFDGFVVALNGDNGAGGASGFQITNTEIKNSTSDGVRFWFTTTVEHGSYIHNNGATGIAGQSTQGFLICNDSVIASNTTRGVSLVTNQQMNSYGCDFANNTTDGIGNGNNGSTLLLFDNIFYGNGGWGVNAAVTNGSVLSISSYNAFGSNTGGTHRSTFNQFNEVTLTATPFTNSGTGDYSLNSTAGGGALLRGGGFPGAFAGGTTTGHPDVGAVQSGSGSCPSCPTCPQHAFACAH